MHDRFETVATDYKIFFEMMQINCKFHFHIREVRTDRSNGNVLKIINHLC